ncbi:hypothetical protein C0992_000022 [Termitomyces sp. T32_za158]|nr:hypothetical protein C0992_000022 [Termitomyces sp. T32_za158]
MPFLRSRYPYAAEYHPLQRPSTPSFPGPAMFAHYNTISRQHSPLLSRFDSTTSSWNFFDKLKNIWSWKDNDLTASAKDVLYAPLYLPSPSEFFHPRPAPLPFRTADRLPYVTSYTRPPLGQNIINKPHAFDTSLALSSVQQQKEHILGKPAPASKVSIARHSKRSRPLSPRHAVHETRPREEGARKRVRFSTHVSGQEVCRLPSRKMRLVTSPKNRFLPFADWIAYHCNNILTEDSCSKLWVNSRDV